MAIDSTYYGSQNSVEASYAMSSPGNGSTKSPSTAKSLISSFSANSNYRRRKSKNSHRAIGLLNDNVHLRSLAEENGDNNYQSSFQLAAKLYKSNSDEFKLKKKLGKKSNKKSVLTLPNERSILPQSCTVSDMNDTEYLKRINKPKSPKTKKRQTVQKKRHLPSNYNYEYYDRDADYCSQMNVYLDCSSVDVVKNFKEDCRKKTNSKTKNDDESSASDVWTVLRNINRFQFQRSPPMSDDSTFEVMPRKKKIHKKKLNRGVYETCRTEQIAYFSNIEVNIPGVISPSGSSQITVIDNQNGFDNISEELEKAFNITTPWINPKNDFVKLTKKKVNSKRSRNSDLAQATTMIKRKSPSKDTLVGLKSEVSLIHLAETSNNHDDSFVGARKENICPEVEVQTEKDLQQKEVDKSRTNPQPRTHNAVSRTGPMSRVSMNQNIQGHLDMKTPIPVSGRGPWCSAQVPNKSPEHPLSTIPKAVGSQASRPLTTAPSKTRASPVSRLSSMAPKTAADLTGHPLTSAPPKTAADSMSRPLTSTPPKTAADSMSRPLTSTPKTAADSMSRPLTSAPPKTAADSMSRPLTSAPPKTAADSIGRLLTSAPPKTAADSMGQPLSSAPPKPVTSPASLPLSMVPSKSATSPHGRPITTTPCKAIGTPAGLTFSKLQDCPRLPQITAEPFQPYTQSAMRRIVAKLKFPLVILGRDQVSGTFEVEEYDYPQFRGLDEQVWPFMIDWINKPNSKSYQVKPTTHSKNQMLKDKTITITEINPSKCNKKEQMGKPNGESNNLSAVAKVKPTSRFRDNMLKLLYKKASRQNIINDSSPARVQSDLKAEKPVQMRSANTNTKYFKTVDVATSSILISLPSVVSPAKTQRQRSPSGALPPTSPSKLLIPRKFRETKPIWGKAKWASDFIENIIKKIKNGTYYTSEIQCKNTKAPLQNRTSDTDDLKQVNDSKEVSIQVSMPLVSEDFTPKITIQKKKELSITLPGFDDVVPELEIKWISRNQIAVKHCVTNVLLQFDVNMPPEADRTLAFKRSTSCVPLSATESKTKVFKCKTRILNAVLPAELCSIIPKVMTQFADREVPIALTLQEEKRNSSLSTISEYTISEIQEPIRLPIKMPQIEMFPELRRLRNGRFSKNPKSCTEISSSNENFYIVNELPYQNGSIEGPLLLRPFIHQKYYFVAQPDHTLVLHTTKAIPTSTLVSPIENSTPNTNLCTALVPYTGNKMVFGDCTNKIQITPVVAFKEFFRMMLKGNTNWMLEDFPTMQLRICNNHVYVNSSINNHQGISTTLCINPTNVNLEPLYVATSNSFRAIQNNGCPEKQIEYSKRATTKELNRTKEHLSNGAICKYRKKRHSRYVKVYKKCKSMSHIAAEKISTPLSKVTNLDEFFQALGAGKNLSSAMDGIYGSKIMSCISDMKNYITGITPRQALLVMLLANKKDTSNLVRFRPMILQGIAVKRITRVSELDMEVEVIEKERLKMPEYLDIPPLLETTQNNNNLLEELYWIAKTTASDYQRRFDESSEKLLKALLEKRKRLNPSYLRVMARYVGLGLLKTPANH